jgi:hypothetical protein
MGVPTASQSRNAKVWTTDGSFGFRRVRTWRGLADDRFPRYYESVQLPPLAINQRGMHMSLTRRTALTAIAATSATGGLATAVGSPYSADPIFAAIERTKPP